MRFKTRRSRSLRAAQLLLGITLALLLPSAAPFAETEAAAPKEDPTSIEALTKRLGAVDAELETAISERTSPQRLERLRAIASTLSQSLNERRALDATRDPAGVPVDAPVDADMQSIGALIRTHEQLDANQKQSQDLVAATKAAEDALGEAEEAKRLAERARRAARDAHEQNPTPEAQQAWDAAKLESRLKQEEFHLRTLQLHGNRAALESARTRAEELSASVDEITNRIRQDRSVRPSADSDLALQEDELSRRRDTLERELARAELELANRSSRYQSQSHAAPLLLEEVETLRIARDAKAQELADIEGRLARLESERELQDQWRAVIQGSASAEETTRWASEADAKVAEHGRGIVQRQGRIAELRADAEQLRGRLDQKDLAPELRPLLAQRLSILEREIDALDLDTRDLDRLAALQQRFRVDLEAISGTMSLRERITSTGRMAIDLWNFELTTIDDEAITVGNALLALFLLSLGFTISRRISNALQRVIENRFQLEPGVAGAVQTAIFYALLISFGLFALRTINFPLTAFTVAGGALAIGVGFGSQNVMNNFISGLILMMERPVRSHDLVELENTHGVVERIGARSTRIRASDGRHIIVPNSFFLENNVVNWTLSDDLIRTKVSVGVCYGSPTRQVRELIAQSLDENERILKSPPPIIIFQEFGDNALNFDAYFWMRARAPMEVNRVSSEVRFRIDDLFRENDLVIAFPQRDVHLDSLKPIEVKMV